MLNRRDFLLLAGGAGLLSVGSGCGAPHPPLRRIGFEDSAYVELPVLGLATSLTEEYVEAAVLEGELPPELSGTLFRNGPGIFDRGGYRKRCLLDGDGMVHGWRLGNGRIDFRNRFVRTEKYNEESAAGKYLYPTWSTQAPGGMLANLGGAFKNQAGISVVVRDGRLFAFDEFQPPYELDPRTLETLGVSWLGQPAGSTVFSAHSKLDRRSGEWIFFGLEHGVHPRIHLTVLGPGGELRLHRTHPLTQQFYMHDFIVSDRHILVHLHPAAISPLPVLLGMSSITGAIRWRPEEGSQVLVFERGGDGQPRRFETEAAWMWHALNAYESGGTIIADFIGYRHPDHFLGRDPALFALMEGRKGEYRFPGELRRFVIDLPANTIRQEVLSGENHEFPAVNPHHACHRHRFGYLLRISPQSFFFDEVTRVDLATGRVDSFRFPAGVYCTEPIFAPVPGRAYEPYGEEPGWLLSEAYDSGSKRSFLAVFRADAVADGPVVQARLPHHLPLGFHGFWEPGVG